MTPEDKEVERLEAIANSLFCNCALGSDDCRKCRIEDRIRKLKEQLPTKLGGDT